MMSRPGRRNRPSALDVSFPEEAAHRAGSQRTDDGEGHDVLGQERRPGSVVSSGSRSSRSSSVATSATLVGSSISSSASTVVSLKRKGEEVGGRAPKLQQLPPVDYYQSRRDEVLETLDMFIPGEGLDDMHEDDEEAEGRANGAQDKPIRLLTDFTVFDPKHRNEMVLLTSIDEDDGADRQIEAAGYVSPFFANEEDVGQEDNGFEEERGDVIYVRLGTLLAYSFDYTRVTEPVYIETPYAWYILKIPAKKYQPYYRHFYTPRRITQLVISSALARRQVTFEIFVHRFESMVDMFGRTYQEQHLWDAAAHIQETILDRPDFVEIRDVPLIRHILRNMPPLPANRPRPPRRLLDARMRRRPLQSHVFLGNPDIALLRPENQNPTHVTPRIAALAQGLVREDLVVVGPPPPPEPSKAVLEARKKEARDKIWACILRAKKLKKRVDYRREDLFSPRSSYLKAVQIEGVIYRVGDFIIVPIGQDGNHPAPELPDAIENIPIGRTMADYFWFARIVYIDIDISKAHIQWLEHGSQTSLQELAHSQELFFNDLCGHVSFQTFVDKVIVHEKPSEDVALGEYFVKFTYDKELATYKTIDRKRLALAAVEHPPNNCPVCLLQVGINEQRTYKWLVNEEGKTEGAAYGGCNYHLDDFVLYRSLEGPANVGYIQDVQFPLRDTSNLPVLFVVRRVGRMSDVATVLPAGMIKDEREVFLTGDRVTLEVSDLVKVCFVCPHESIPDLDEWLALSPDHFFIRYAFPSMKVNSWDEKTPVLFDQLPLCRICLGERLEQRQQTHQFFEEARRRPFSTLDIFGGVGAFSHGLAEGSGCMSVTHSIEISPSAAKTTLRNHPHVVMYNQCANVMLRYAIKHNQGHRPEVPKQLFDSKTPVPGCPKPGQFHIVTMGLPCQPHSGLNMFKRANDVKSNLVLNALSWVDFLRPVICYVENVPGFLNFTFDAVQVNQHRVEGGIPMGGLKFMQRALIDMGYQVRFGLLQAGNYGTPQGRIRFFLIAALDGHPLPEFPQPSHDFPVVHGLQIKLPVGGKSIRPIRVTTGTAPHPMVTIDDAISDLPRFDWKHPRFDRLSRAKQRELLERERTIPSVECKRTSPHSGLRGHVEYQHPPRTTYQLAARSRPPIDLQHFTKCLHSRKVERVVLVPLSANADYRDLPTTQYEWQIANPVSSVARKKYRPGVYGRLDKNSYFPTTVTNVDPTAKQSRVLNPYCRRMVTVRELARSQGFADHFVFEAIGNNVVTMHRQIGNAVPYPVGRAMGRELRVALKQKWMMDQDKEEDRMIDV